MVGAQFFTPIMGLFLTVAFVWVIFLWWKVLKKTSLALFSLFCIFSSSACSLLYSISLVSSRLSLSPQIFCCEIISLVIDVSMFQILSYNVSGLGYTITLSGLHKAPCIEIPPKHSEHQSILIRNDIMTAPHLINIHDGIKQRVPESFQNVSSQRKDRIPGGSYQSSKYSYLLNHIEHIWPLNFTFLSPLTM